MLGKKLEEAKTHPFKTPPKNHSDFENRPVKLTTYLFAILLVTIVFLLTVGTPMSLTGLRLIICVLVFFLAGFSLIPINAIQQDSSLPRGGQSIVLVLLSMGTGMCAAFILWLVCAFVLKDFTFGTIGSLLFASAGIIRLRKNLRLVADFFTTPSVLVVSAISVLMGIYILGVNEIQIGDQTAYTYRWDWDSHLLFASLVREFGLPSVSDHGSPKIPFQAIGHFGYQVFLVGIEQMSQTSLYQAARLMGVFGFWLLSLSGLALTMRLLPTGAGAPISAVSSLLWGGLLLPISIYQWDINAILDPYQNGAIERTIISGTMYHNMTQLLAVAISAIALVALDAFCHRRNLRFMVLACILIVLAGLTKPSVFIVSAPALVLVMVTKRETFQAWLISLGIFAVGIFLYIMPAIVIDAPQSPITWELNWAGLMKGKEILIQINALGLGLIVIGFWTIKFLREIPKSRQWNWYDVQIIAVFGGAIFALVFSETGSQSFHGNQYWPFAGAVIPLSAFIVAKLWQFCFDNRALWKSSWLFHMARVLIICVAISQLAGSMFYAGYYPKINAHLIATNQIVALEESKKLTTPETRFLIDPSLHKRSLAPYLSRPALWLWTIPRYQEIENKKNEWINICRTQNGNKFNEFLEGYSAVILRPLTFFARNQLRQQGWTAIPVGKRGDYELWLP